MKFVVNDLRNLPTWLTVSILIFMYMGAGTIIALGVFYLMVQSTGSELGFVQFLNLMYREFTCTFIMFVKTHSTFVTLLTLISICTGMIIMITDIADKLEKDRLKEIICSQKIKTK